MTAQPMATSTTAALLCVGIATLDYIYGLDVMPTRPEKFRAKDLTVVGGGLAANAAVAAARLGGKVSMAARLGDDLAGAAIREEFQREGIACALVKAFAGLRSPVSAILVDAAGERLVVSYADPALPAAPDWLPDRLPGDTRAVCGDTRWPEGAGRMFAAARAAGGIAVLDGDRAAPLELIDAATHVAFSEQGLREMTGLGDPAAGLEMLARRGASWLAVTLGERGVLHWQDGRAVHTPGFTVEVVDTLGAGDVWHGAFALALAEGQGERRAIRFANAAAALKCTKFGGRAGAPRRDEIETFLKGHQA